MPAWPTPIVPDRPLLGAVLDLLSTPPARVLVAGAPRLATALRAAGHVVREAPARDARQALEAPAEELETMDALLLVNCFREPEESREELRALVRRARPGALVLLVESAAWGPGGRLLARALRRLFGRPVVAGPSRLAALCLNVGLREIRQTWPQGLRSLILTRGTVHPQAPRLLG